MGRDVEHAICYSIRETNPDRLVFIHTPESLAKVEVVKEILQEEDPDLWRKIEGEIECHEVVADDLATATERSIDILEGLMAIGYSRRDITLDYTCGTKVMSAALAIASIITRVESLSYVSGKRGKNGRVMTGTESLRRERLLELFVREEIKKAVSSFNRWRFEEAMNILENVKETVRAPEIESEIHTLLRLSNIYMKYDLFDFNGALKLVDGSIDSEVLKRYGIVKRYGKNIGMLKVLSDARHSSEEVLEYGVVLYANAIRRLREGRYDDCVARLYRTIEFIEQYTLKRYYGVESSNVDMEKLYERDSAVSEFCGEIGLEDKRKVGLRDGFELLEVMGDEIGIAFKEDENIKKLLEARNMSVLAHGFVPVKKEVAEELSGKTLELLKKLFSREQKDISKYLQMAEFPELKLT
ncbi:MAG: TIGR02710 family CRISPR-associated CARF protein [Methermicoccaceae archaeon]